MPLVRSSRRQRVRRSGTGHGASRRRSSQRRSRGTAAAWADVLEAPVSLHRQQVMLLGVGLIAGWASLLFVTVSAFG